MEYLTRNGMTATEATKSLGNVLKLAQANAIDLASAADMLTNVMNMFGLSVSDGEKIVDILSTTAAHTATNVTELYGALVNAAPAAKVLGFSLEEVSAALGALAQRGVKAENAGTQLRMALVKMADPKIVAKMNEMGVAINEETMKSEGLLGTVKRLVDAHLSLSDLVAIFSQKGAVGVQQLIGAYEDFEYVLGYTSNAAGTANRMFEQGVGSIRKEVDILKNKWNEFLISVNGSGGVFRSIVRLFQNLIDNFKTTAGTLLNLGSVIIPVLSSNFGKLVRAFQVGFKQIQVDAIATKVAIGNIVGVVATLVTWIGTALYGAWSRNTQAMRDAKEQMASVEGESGKLKSETEMLISKLGPDSDNKTLGGVVKRLTEMFPDFSDAIKRAADEARKTKNWENFRDILREIAGLQGQILARDASVAMRNAAGEQIGTSLYNTYRKVPEHEGSVLSQFSQHAYERFGNNFEMRDAYLKSIMMTIGKTIADAGGDLDSAAVSIKNYADALGMDTTRFSTTENVNKKFRGGGQLTGTISRDLAGNIWKELSPSQRELIQSIRKVTTTIDTVNGKIDSSGLMNSGGDTGSTVTPTGGNEEAGKLVGDLKEINSVLENYRKKNDELSNRLKNGTITQKKFDEEVAKLEDDTWEAITAISNFGSLLETLGEYGIDNYLENQYKVHRSQDKIDARKEQIDALSKYFKAPVKGVRDTTYDYTKTPIELQEAELEVSVKLRDDYKDIVNELQEAINKGDFNLIKDDAIRLLQRYKELLSQASDEAETMQHKLNFAESIKKIDDQIKELNVSTYSTITTLAQAFDRLYDAVENVVESLGGELDDDVKEKWEGFFAIINAGVQLMEVAKTVTELFSAIEAKRAKEKVKEAAMEVGANAAVAISEKEKAKASAEAAAAGAASSVASVPYVGPLLAVGAIASVIAAILASTAKFAKGGIVGGNSYSGDRQIVRANSGEFILNKAQQGTLWNMLNGKGSFGGDVQFRIKGGDLVGAIKNYNTIKNG